MYIRSITDSEKVPAQSINVKISFVEKDVSFIKVKWTSLNNSLNAASEQWDFIAFGSDHKSAILEVFNQQAFIAIKNEVSQIEENGNYHEIIVEELKSSPKRGIIYNKFTIPLTDEEIKAILLPQGIEEIYRIQKFDMDNNQKCYTGSIIITFTKNLKNPSVIIGKVIIPISKLTPRPMLCAHCGLLGHTNKRCKKNRIDLCSTCFYNHDEEQACNLLCKNCNEEHYSNNKECNTLKKEIQILKVKESHNINYFDAKKIVESMSEVIDEAGNDRESDRKTERIKSLIEDNNKLREELRSQREISKKQADEIIHLKSEIPSIKEKFTAYRADNDAKEKELQDLLEQETLKSTEEICSLTKENIELRSENKTAEKKMKDLQLKYNNSKSFFQEFSKISEIVEPFFQ